MDLTTVVTSYDLGKIEAHGAKTIDVKVSDEGIAGSYTRTTGIYSTTAETITLSAARDVFVDIITGSSTNDSLKLLDATNVGGKVNINVISLGDGAVVKLTQGDDTFSALGSAGKGVTIYGYGGDNNITGTAQSDYIYTEGGKDIIAADRGDNVVKTGDGTDIVTSKDGNDTVDLGTGFFEKVQDNIGTKLDEAKATTTVSKSFGIASVEIDVNGDNTVDVSQNIAVGDGSVLTLKWSGDTLDLTASSLDGVRSPGVNNITATNNPDLYIVTNDDATSQLTINAGEGNDVALVVGGNIINVDGTQISGTNDTQLTFYGGGGNDAAVGGTGDDNLNGDDGNDLLYGFDGSDTLNGGSGDDVLIGGAKSDEISTGFGADKIVLSEDFKNLDKIGDFDGTSDKIYIDAITATVSGNNIVATLIAQGFIKLGTAGVYTVKKFNAQTLTTKSMNEASTVGLAFAGAAISVVKDSNGADKIVIKDKSGETIKTTLLKVSTGANLTGYIFFINTSKTSNNLLLQTVSLADSDGDGYVDKFSVKGTKATFATVAVLDPKEVDGSDILIF